MFLFRGLGWAATAFRLCCRILAGALVGSESSSHRWDIVAVAIIVAFAFYFSFGAGRVLLAKANGGYSNFNSRRSLQFRSYLYWAPIIVGFATCCMLYK